MAPVTGTYTFRGTADDDFAMYLSADYGSVSAPASPLIYSNTYSKLFEFYTYDVATGEGSIDLTAGKSYYMEAYHINTGSTGNFDISVEMPNADNTTHHQTHQVDKISTVSTVQQEIKLFTVTGGTTGTIELHVIRMDGREVDYEKKVNFTYGATASQFQNAIDDFDGYSSGYGLTTVRTIYDSSNNVITTLTGAAKIEYEVSIYKLRSTSLQAEEFRVSYYDNFTGTFTESQTQTHSPLLTGTFGLSIGGVDIEVGGSTAIPYDSWASTIQDAIRSQLVGFENM